jgi:hypothetical protein
MPPFVEHREALSHAHKMIYIGGISALNASDANFEPSRSSYVLPDTFLVKSSMPCEDVDKTKDSSVCMDQTIIPWPKGGGSTYEAFTVADGVFRSSGDHVMIIRNGSPKFPNSWETLWKVCELDPNINELDVLSYGKRLQLKWGDVIIVKPVRSSFHSVGSRNAGPYQLEEVEEDCDVYVCIPPLAPAASAALFAPGVLRKIRERVEEFVLIWDASWDSTLDRVVFTRDGQRQQDYEKLDFDVLKQRTESVRLIPEPDGAGFSSMISSMKRALDDNDDDSSAKRPKH